MIREECEHNRQHPIFENDKNLVEFNKDFKGRKVRWCKLCGAIRKDYQSFKFSRSRDPKKCQHDFIGFNNNFANLKVEWCKKCGMVRQGKQIMIPKN